MTGGEDEAGGGRRYGGRTSDERRAERLERLREAALEVVGTRGWAEATMTEVCRVAGLTERYFYESFADRDTFVRAVYAWVGEQAKQSLLDASRRAGSTPERIAGPVRAFVELMVDRPEMGRVLLIAPLAEPALSRRGLALLPGFVDLIESQLGDAPDRHLDAVGMVGALTALFIGYLDGTLVTTRDTLVEHCVQLLSRVQG